MAFLVDGFVLLRDVKLPEEVEGNDGVDVDDDGQEHHGQDELLAVVSDGFEDDPQSGDADGDVQQVGSKEEVVVISQN